MLSYELCKKLKEAGFPLKETIVYQVEPGIAESMGFVEIDGKHYMQPYLSELIEACGEEFKSLDLYNSEGDGRYWSADAVRGLMDYKTTSGDTPEEAVCHLYLALKNETN